MSIHLVGGGRRPGARRAVYGPFVAEVAAHARRREAGVATVVVVVVHEPDDVEGGAAAVEAFAATLAGLGTVTVRPALVVEGGTLGAAAIAGADGVLVGGGLTPAYLDALLPVADELRSLVADGVAYLGFSAGAAVAARRALVGGYRQGAVVVCPEDAAEDLDQVTVRDGLGLVDLTVEVHAAQWGTLGRLVAAVDAGQVGSGVALDEDTLLTVGSDLAVAGAGQTWWVRREGDQVAVRLAAASS